ncbi:MAG: hypothetical protein GEU78_05480 [Actinobacteria bacterium]|nr:hypothetical protein [Actinomycetota bacterium]
MLSAPVMLDLWERAEDLRPVERALALAAAGGTPPEVAELEALPLGRRDARILRLRRQVVGETLEAIAACPACAELVEFEVDAGALLARDGNATSPAPLEKQGFVVGWRPPDSRDVAAASGAADAAAAERVLLERCVAFADAPEGELEGPELPSEVREVLTEAMAAADPLAEVLVDLACPACETGFVADLDLAGFVWEEVRERAQRLLREVHLLALAYGWTEPEVLGLSERRRAEYLRLAREGVA